MRSIEVCLIDLIYCQIARVCIAIIVDGFFRHVLKSKFHNASVQSDQRLCCSSAISLLIIPYR